MNRQQYVDLVISEAKPASFRKLRGEYGVCTLSNKRGQKYINLRIPDSVQDRILKAYAQGKVVRIFA
ncbi:MAG: hypothetical protein R3313_03105 [Candidatus Saccharimonadales bacterium]|nr:hypothetical protein [Candidatus Saccharimonadales bacterium]